MNFLHSLALLFLLWQDKRKIRIRNSMFNTSCPFLMAKKNEKTILSFKGAFFRFWPNLKRVSCWARPKEAGRSRHGSHIFLDYSAVQRLRLTCLTYSGYFEDQEALKKISSSLELWSIQSQIEWHASKRTFTLRPDWLRCLNNSDFKPQEEPLQN